MKFSRWVCVAAAVALAAGALPAPTWAKHAPRRVASGRAPLSRAQLAKVIAPAIVRLTVLGADGQPGVQGTGFVVGKNLVATNAHALRHAHSVTANYADGRSERVDGVAAMDAARDLAVLSVNTAGVRPLPLAPGGAAHVGDPVLSVGGPVSAGAISRIRFYDATRLIQTTAPISRDSSGGPLVNQQGQAVGVTSFFETEGRTVRFAYSTAHLRPLLTNPASVVRSWSELEPLWDRAAAPVLPLPTPPGTDEDDAQALGAHMMKFGECLQRFGTINSNPNLDNPEWQRKMEKNAQELQALIAEERKLAWPSVFLSAEDNYETGLGEYDYLARHWASAVKNSDLDALKDCQVHAERARTLVLRAEDRINKVTVTGN